MSSTTPSRLRRARAALLGLLVLVGAVVAGPAAHAHDVLIASEPEEGAVLDEAPEAIVLTFNNSPLDVGSAISVVDADGTAHAEGEGSVQGTDVVLELDSALPAGELEVRWRVASSDGHPIEGVIPFTLEIPAEPAAPDPPATQDATAEAAAADPEPATPEPAADADEAAAASGSDGLPTWLQVVIGIAALGAVAGLVVIVVKRLRADRV